MTASEQVVVVERLKERFTETLFSFEVYQSGLNDRWCASIRPKFGWESMIYIWKDTLEELLAAVTALPQPEPAAPPAESERDHVADIKMLIAKYGDSEFAYSPELLFELKLYVAQLRDMERRANLQLHYEALEPIAELISRLERGCTCGHDHRCGNCDRIIQLKAKYTAWQAKRGGNVSV